MTKPTIRVLFIEDDLVDRVAFQRFLKSRTLPYQCTVVDCLKAAREQLALAQFDVIITDYSLGDGTCLDLLRELGPTPCIVVTGTGSEETAVEAMKLGARDYLIKDPGGHHLTVLPSTVNSVLNRVQAENELQRYREHLEELVRERTADLLTEIQERERVAEALRKSEERLRAALSAAEMGTWWWDASSDQETRDPALNRILGLAAVESTQSLEDFFDRIHSDDRADARAEFRRAISGRDTYLAEFRIVRPDGQIRWLRDQGRPFYRDSGELAYVTGAAVDITERKNAEEERAQLEAQLYQAQKLEALGQLAGGVAHDFGNLATVILGNTSVIRHTVHDYGNVAPCLDMIDQAATGAASMTKSLLTFCRKMPTEKMSVDLGEHVAKSLRMCRRLLPAAVDVTEDTKSDEAIVVHADPTQLEQILLNLVINARDAMPNGGRLHVVVKTVRAADMGDLSDLDAAETYAALEVIDTGCGMSPEVQSRIFDPFFTTKERGRGTGLGLAVVLGIVRNHGGKIVVRSAVGEGTTFTVLLPRAVRVVAEGEQARDAEPARGHGELLLVAEDDVQIRSILASTLRSIGYEVVDVGDGEEALSRCRRPGLQFRLFVWDVDLPKRSGLECLRELRAEGCQIPAILVTATASIDAQVDLPRDTILLRKPFAIDELRRLIADRLAGSPGPRDATVHASAPP